MQLSCNAPASFWDKFCATLAYLSNLTASTTLNRKTPYKVWTGRVPSLSHLREIGCRAFALIQTHNPKIYRQSRPCILIGYAPHAKAYRLWDTIDGSIFNSFHVTFVEHLDQQPVDLLPGTMITIEPNAPLSWDASPSPQPRSAPPPPPLPDNTTLRSPSLGENRHNVTPSPLSLSGRNCHEITPPSVTSSIPSSPSSPPSISFPQSVDPVDHGPLLLA